MLEAYNNLKDKRNNRSSSTNSENLTNQSDTSIKIKSTLRHPKKPLNLSNLQVRFNESEGNIGEEGVINKIINESEGNIGEDGEEGVINTIISSTKHPSKTIGRRL